MTEDLTQENVLEKKGSLCGPFGFQVKTKNYASFDSQLSKFKQVNWFWNKCQERTEEDDITIANHYESHESNAKNKT